MRAIAKSVAGPAALVGLLVLMILHAEGARGLAVFLNIEALAVVVLGAAAATWTAFPARDIAAALAGALRGGGGLAAGEAGRGAVILRAAAENSVSMGVLATVLGLIMLLSSPDNAWTVLRRIALSLDGLLFGLLLANTVLRPLSRRLDPA